MTYISYFVVTLGLLCVCSIKAQDNNDNNDDEGNIDLVGEQRESLYTATQFSFKKSKNRIMLLDLNIHNVYYSYIVIYSNMVQA